MLDNIIDYYRFKQLCCLSVWVCMHKCVFTRPSLGMMLVRWTTSRWADWETKESDDREIMWSHIPAKVLHWRFIRCKKKEHGKEMTEREKGTKRGRQKVIEIGFGPWGILWPSWRRWNRNHFIRLFHIATFITPAHKLLPVTVCPQACPQDIVTDRTTHHWYQPTLR